MEIATGTHSSYMLLRFREAIELLTKFQLLIGLHALVLENHLLLIHGHFKLWHRGLLRGPGQFIASDSSRCRFQSSLTLHDQRLLRRWHHIDIVHEMLGFIDWWTCCLVGRRARFSVRQCLFPTWLNRLIESKLFASREWLLCRCTVALISQFHCFGESTWVLSHINLCFTFFYLLTIRYCELINPNGRQLASTGRSSFMHSSLTFKLNCLFEVSLDRPLNFFLLESNRLHNALQPKIWASGWYLPFNIISAVSTIVMLLLR